MNAIVMHETAQLQTSSLSTVIALSQIGSMSYQGFLALKRKASLSWTTKHFVTLFGPCGPFCKIVSTDHIGDYRKEAEN